MPAAEASVPETVFLEEKAASVAYSTTIETFVALSPSAVRPTVALAEFAVTEPIASVPAGGFCEPVTNDSSVFVAERPLEPVTTTLTK